MDSAMDSGKVRWIDRMRDRWIDRWLKRWRE